MHSLRSRAASPEAHAARIRQLLQEHRGRNLVVDPISALGPPGEDNAAQRAAIEILDLAKSRSVTSVYTSLLGNKAALSEETPIGISTIADTWMHLSYVNQGRAEPGADDHQVARHGPLQPGPRAGVLGKNGVTLADVYSAGGEVLMGTLRWERETQERQRRNQAMREADLRKKQAELTLAESRARAQAALSAQAVQEAALERVSAEREEASGLIAVDHAELLRRRGADGLPAPRRRSRRTR